MMLWEGYKYVKSDKVSGISMVQVLASILTCLWLLYGARAL